MSRNKYNEICILNSVYSLLVFLLSKKSDVDDVLFVFWKDVPEEISVHFDYVKDKDSGIMKKNAFLQFFFNLAYLFRTLIFIKKYTNKNTVFYGQDHIPFSRYIINYTSFQFVNIEDGLANYVHSFRPAKKGDWLRKLLLFDCEDKFGYSERVKSQYLTNARLIENLPEKIRRKSILIDLIKGWKSLSVEKQGYINNVYNVNHLDKLRGKVPLILTGPYEEEELCTESEKVSFIDEYLKKNGINSGIIKPHYREKTNYEELFPGFDCVSPYIPIELVIIQWRSCISVVIAFHTTTSLSFLRDNFEIPIVEHNIFNILNKKQHGK